MHATTTKRSHFFGPFTDFPDQKLIEAHFATLLSPTPTQLKVQAYYADLQHTYLLHIPKGLIVEEPIELTFEESITHLLVIVEEGAKVEIVEILRSTERKHVIELFVADNASVDFVLLQNTPAEASVWIQQRSKIGSNAQCHVRNVTLGGKNVTHDLVSRIEGAASMSAIDWIFYGKEEEKQMLSSRNVFDAPAGGGEITVQGVAEGKAHTTFNGMIEITPRGGGTNTYLTETTLMLDPTAKVDAIPGLEIKTNDVKASHSATVTKVSPEDLFYFASRGIPEREARKMYIEGFLGDLTQRFLREKMRDRVQREIAAKYDREI